MSEKRYKRFYVSESENQLTIYDNEGLDDYYHLGNDERDVKGICKLLNEQQATISSLQTELELTANTKLFSRKELERKVEEQQAEIERLQKIIDLTTYQLKVQDRIIQKMEEKE